ncbi:MAG: YHYH protein [Flavobacteriales bacterium]|nr:YHYH protein [Flavobacteriales bacterium]
MKKPLLTIASFCVVTFAHAQLSPAITSWLQNTTTTARHYVSGNSTPINDPDLVNVQKVQYNATHVYVTTTGLPSYVTGPFLDGNPSVASDQSAVFKFPLNPVVNSGTPVNTVMGNIGVFINGVALFDYRDGVSWNNSTNSLAGGPLGGSGDGQWNRDAVVAEMGGFDCNKAHPAMGNYHHHQNPSAFDLDLVVVSTICNLYDAEGLYAIDSSAHSPLIGFAYDGFPIYGAYAYKNVNGTGPIVRMKSSYSLNSGTTRTNGPPVNGTYPLGTFREDYHYTATSSATPDFLDEHNGRFCVTPEYPAGTYCYFATVDENWNSAYPYVVGPTFYGSMVAAKVTSVPSGTTTYVATTGVAGTNLEGAQVSVFPNPSSELLIIQLKDLNKENLKVELYDMNGKLVQTTTLLQGSTIAHFDTKTLYGGQYLVKISNGTTVTTRKVIVTKD